MRRLGEMIAEVFIALLLVAAMAVAFFLAGKPFWPEHEARTVILLPPDALTTGSFRVPTQPHLPATSDPRLQRSKTDGRIAK